jgi:D-3-phosphoglycerate dehydrogenase
MPTYIIDFDSTFIQTESLEELAALALLGNSKKDSILARIKAITVEGMEGKIPFEESLSQRIKLLSANRALIKKLIIILKKKITPSILSNRDFFKTHAKHIFIISGGFIEFIWPVVSDFGLLESNIIANSFLFDEQGEVVGYDKNNVLSRKGGKPKAIHNLGLKGDIVVVGDGYTDYEIKKAGVATEFIAFTENVRRESVVAVADRVVSSFDEVVS